MKKLSVLVCLLAVLFPSLAYAQTSYGRIVTDRISNKATIIITGATPDVSDGNVFKTSNALPATITRVQEPLGCIWVVLALDQVRPTSFALRGFQAPLNHVRSNSLIRFEWLAAA